ncbi:MULTISPECIES: hypothetical protein [Streptococcus]|uniref:hypothetical protein n=1 Tax=Streptococcus TaxID=1301 RepID=UPI00066A8BA8|nr:MULTISPECIES: hypothetical protein [Streptococcus]OFN54251.1 hypothetical protein HMPREF2542_04725 [Streptococcus sp. HMSC034B05]PNM84409.1 hypothetical protein AL506_007840 [Streptococcus sp. FDAARGOS_146]
MRKKICEFLRDTGAFQTFLSLVLVFVFIVDNLIPSLGISIKENNFFNWSIITTFFISSLFYIFKYRPMNVGYIEKSTDYKKIISLIREIDYTISLIVVTAVVYRFCMLINILSVSTENSLGIINIIALIITIRLYFSVISIIIGLKKWVLLLLIIIGVPLIYLVGVFDISWWALISGLMIIWNFINSKDFLTLFNKGTEIDKVPKKLNFIWQRNKIVFYIVTTLIYLVLIISGSFENNKMSILDRANVRITTLALLMMAIVFIFVVILLLKYLFSHNKMLQKFVKGRKENWFFIKLASIIEFYLKYHKYIISLNNKNKYRRIKND